MLGKEYFEEIIFRHLCGEASALEESKLAAWLKDRPENQAEFDNLVRIWEESSKLSSALNFDKSQAWDSLENKMNQVRLKSWKRIPFYSRSFRVAAAIILLGVSAELIYYAVRPKAASRIDVLALQTNRQIQLPDGSAVMLRKGSSLHYSSDYPENGRQVDLSGEAYFNVQHDENNPFTIHTSKSVIRELGTSFLVKSTEREEQVFVTSGTVKVSEKKDTSKNIILTTGQTVSIIGKLFDKESITDSNYLAWKSGILEFNNAPLKKMILDLDLNFQVNILLSDKLAAKSDSVKVNFRFENNTLDQILDEIHVTTGWTIERDDKKILMHE